MARIGLTFLILVFSGLADSGALPQWTLHPLDDNAVRLRGSSTVNDDTAWISGSNGTIRRTIERGLTWQKVQVPGAESLDFRDIDAFSQQIAYALSVGPSDASRIFKTKDGGQSWDAQFVNRNPKAFFDSMAFWNQDRGIAVSDSVDGQFIFITTENGGRTWTNISQHSLPPALPNEGFFAASGTNVTVFGSNHVWAGTTTGRVLRSTDRGRSWHVAKTPLATGPSAGIFSIVFRDARHGIVVGGDYKKEDDATDNAAITTDGGITWTSVTGLSGFRSAVSYIPGMNTALLTVGPNGADYSLDNGRTWARIDGAGFDAVSFARNGMAGWAVGANGRVARFDAAAIRRLGIFLAP